MRTIQALLFGLLLGAGAVTSGCMGANPDGASVGSSQARLVLSVQGNSSATLHVTATDDASAAVAADKTIEINAGGTQLVDLSLAPASYTFHVDVLGGASGTADLCSNSAHADLAAGETTQITLTAQVDGFAGGNNGSASVQIGVDVAPQIQGVQVTMNGSGAGATANIQVDAVDADGGSLAFFWSGAGLQGAVQGSSTLSLSTAAVAASSSSPVVHVVVQDQQGTTASADIALAVSASGDVQGSVSSNDGGDDAAAKVQACLQAQAQCNAGCSAGLGLGSTVSANASCLANCSLALASCETP